MEMLPNDAIVCVREKFILYLLLSEAFKRTKAEVTTRVCFVLPAGLLEI